MEETEEQEEGVLEGLSAGPGERLRAAREAKGLTLEQIAAETRIPQRHLETLEAGKFGTLPGRTYAIGFSRTYAKTVGLDTDEIVEQVREELGGTTEHYEATTQAYEPGDPARAPSGGLVWISVGAIALLLVGGYMFYSSYLSPGAELPAQVAEETSAADSGSEPRQAVADNAAASGPVVFTSLQEGSWIKFYDQNGTRLMEKEMARGERYTVPADAEGPQVRTGRPYAFSITVGGRPVPKLSEEDEVVSDVPVTAEALVERGRATANQSSDAG